MAQYYDPAKGASKVNTSATSPSTGNRNERLLFSAGPPWLCDVVRNILNDEFRRSVPRFHEDKGPTIILDSRYGEPSELQCMATLLDALGMPLRHAVEQMYCDSQCGHIRVTICSSDIFLAKIIVGHLDHALNAYNVAHYGESGHAGLSVTYRDEHLASV
jgi:hypothetical protein